MTRTQIWMCGGGTQSSAIAALIVQGKLRPDLAVIVDTEREQSTTWDYMDQVTGPALASVGVTLHRVQKSLYTKADVFGGKDGQTILVPIFSSDSTGNHGKFNAYCSGKWKTEVGHRWATKEHGVKAASVWVGISTDEMRRVNPVTGKWQTRYPLIEQKMNRGDCIALVKRMGWPEPPRSSCWMCPNHTQVEWRDIRDNKPKDWRRAVLFDRWIRRHDAHAFLHGDAIPLDKADLDDKNESLFTRCESGMCFT